MLKLSDHDLVSLRQELDREQAAILENESRGLGLQGMWYGKPNWYGGQIQQVARLERQPGPKEAKPQFRLTLLKMQMTRSHHFARFLGSRRLLQIKIADVYTDLTAEREYLKQKLVICGRIFRPFSAKDGRVYAVEVNEDYKPRKPDPLEGDQHRLSLEDIVAWHNPLHLNDKQVCPDSKNTMAVCRR